MTQRSPSADDRQESEPAATGHSENLLTCSVAAMPLAVPVSAVVRILRMAAFSPGPNPPPGVAGLLNVAGDILPVVDPRPLLGLQATAPLPGHHLVLLSSRGRFLLWVDAVGRMLDAPCLPAPTTAGALAIERVAQIDGRVVPILDPAALDPSSAGPRPADPSRLENALPSGAAEPVS